MYVHAAFVEILFLFCISLFTIHLISHLLFTFTFDLTHPNHIADPDLRKYDQNTVTPLVQNWVLLGAATTCLTSLVDVLAFSAEVSFSLFLID